VPDYRVKRVYEDPNPKDGLRVLVDRIWPRGMSKEKARIDSWMKELGPSTELRKWFGHDPAKWSEFRRRYFAELKQESVQEALQALFDLSKGRKVVTLLYSARGLNHNQAVALREFLLKK
jgi:uncharacterized protein YeaO (DUF488 family)